MSRAPVEIHGYVNCPFAWRVRLAAAEKGVPADWIPCDVDDPDPRARTHNPDEHSPLLYDDGFELLESEVMMQYLDERGPGRPLMPMEARHRAELRLLATRLRSLDVHNEPSRPEARRRSHSAIQLLESQLNGHPFLHGQDPGHVDFLIWPFVANLGARGLIDDARARKASAYLRRAAARPSFHDTAPPWAAPLFARS